MTSTPTTKTHDAASPSPSSIAERWASVNARDIMRTQVITIPYATPLSEVERILSDNRISGAPVTDESGRIIGVVSVRDLVERYAEDPDSRPRRGQGFYHLSAEEMLDDDFDSFEVPEESEDTAQDVMTGQVHSVDVDAGLMEIARVMSKHKIHRVLVAEGGRHVGLVTTTEVLGALAG